MEICNKMESAGYLSLFAILCLFKTVTGQNQRPIFEKTFYVAEITEEQKNGFSVIQLKASIIGGGNPTFRLDATTNHFTIDQSSGWIAVLGRLDREASDTRRFNAYAKNNANGLESKVQVVVHLTDINDNTPVFLNLPATVKLKEDIDINTVVFTVTASDADTSRNALLMYSIAKGNEEGRFSIDLYSGRISTKSMLDFETVKDYNITVKVQDSGENTTKSNSSTVRIKIQDHDDQPGKFLQTKYFATVPENSLKGTNITTVKAVDMDSAINAPVYYGIEQDSNPENAFAIDKKTGVITVNGSLDRESSAVFLLRVSATSTIFNPDYATVHISLSDKNDNKPAFLQPRYDVAVMENVKPGATILKVTAQDKDLGINSEVGYSIVGGDAKFAVLKSGDVILVNAVDREKQAAYTFVVVAAETKTAELYDTSVPVHVTIKDINDNAPQFEKSNYTAYVKENLRAGTSVITVKVKDRDIGENAFVTFNIIQGNSSSFQPFAVNSKTGEIKTLILLDREKIPLYKFAVEAVNSQGNPPLSERASVSVIVQDENDNSPIFNQSNYDAYIVENSRVNSFVFNLTALDSDIGINAVVKYQIISGDNTKFQIDANSGEIRTTKILDREAKEKYELVIKAEDGKRKNGTTKLITNVMDVNDNYPEFSLASYQFYVMEAIQDASVGQVKATDRDKGANSDITYTITKGQEHFLIEPKTGVLKGKHAFDYENVRVYQLVVVAFDNGFPLPKRSIANITVTILDSNDHKPTFSSRLYRFNVTENGPSHVIGHIHATDNDSGINGALSYKILSGNENGDFALNSSSGSLALVKMLDRERRNLFVLIVSAMDKNRQKNSLEDLAAVEVAVNDENDNAPVFLIPSKSLTLKEDAPAGSFVISFYAVDKDTGMNSAVEYNITAGNTNNRFAIDVISGRVYIQSPIDRDPPNSEQYFELSIQAKDKGRIPKSSIAKMFVTVIDANDNRPTFSQAENVVSVFENVTIGSIIFSTNCTDKDSGNNGVVSYQLMQGAENGFVADTNSGLISTTKAFDYDTGSNKFELVLRASDSGTPPLTSTAKVIVSILNINDNWPLFLSSGPFNFIEGNYKKERYKIGTLKAHDNDSDQAVSSYGVLSYSFVNMSSYAYDFYWPFNDLLSATTTKERKSNASAVLHGARLVTDASMGSVFLLSGSPQSVSLGDFKGDCISNPTLCKNGLTVSLWIKFEAGGFIISSGAQSIFATGFSFEFEAGSFRLRLATNSKEYEIKLSSIPSSWFYFTFTWSESNGLAYYENGMLKSKSYVSRPVQKTIDIYTKLVLGRPNHVTGSPQLYGRLYVGEVVIWKLRLEDFEVKHAFHNSERKTGVAMLQPLTYYDLFQVDKTTGDIFAVEEIDREKRSSYSLDVKASDNDPIEPKSNYTQVILYVTDVNDNAPKFDNATFRVRLLESASSGTNVYKLTAVDPDAGSNGQVRYSLDLGNTGNVFSIDPVSGQIKTTSILDRELVSFYTLQISASDGGSLSRKATVVVYIEILDTNDEFPVFTQKQYFASIKENLASGHPVLRVKAVDKDFGNNGLVTFNVSSNYFSIGLRDGQITTKTPLDRENIAQHVLIVTASDGGISPKSSSATVAINVVDENDNTPQFQQSTYYAVVAENRKLGSSVLTVIAMDSDADKNGIVRYTITGGNGKFDIDTDTGTIKTVDSIDREKFTNGFAITIMASDQGAPPLSSSAVLRINISDINDNSPVFNKFSYRGSVLENVIGMVAVVVNATDADEGLAGGISYSIIAFFSKKLGLLGGNSDGTFIVDNNGRVKTGKRLDRETKSAYELILRATDRAGDPKYSDVEVDIQVIDVNDNPPVIGRLPSNILISEATLTGTQVTTITATDKDTGNNQKVSFYGISSDGKFSIDAATGAVYTLSNFDYETNPRHTFYVGSYDHGTPRLNSTLVAVNFTVGDTNDNNPVFNPSIYLAKVPENSPLNTTVIKVNASEKDRSARISYYISNGNQEYKFIINNSTGLISVQGGLDREKQSTYFLLIIASDNEVPPRLGQAYVTITVADVNDLAPKFKFRDYKAEIAENAQIGTVVLHLSATDADSANQTKLIYKVENGNIGNTFSISNSGSTDMENAILKTAGHLDRETISIFHLRISVFDGIHADIVNVTIKIKDLNDNPPVFNTTFYQASVFENTMAGHSIIKVNATDKDEGSNAIIKYSFLFSNTKLSINELTGEITTSRVALDRESEPSYTIVCKATDSGGLQSQAVVQVKVLDRNDERPVFSPSSYYSQITEGTGSKGSTVALVKATDADSGTNAKLTYSIKSGNLGNTFSIHPHTGIVKAILNVDREQHGLKYDQMARGFFELVIEASDQGSPSLSAASPARVTVYVLDINDNIPSFPAGGLHVFISEGAKANQNVTAAVAVDKDAGVNSTLLYEIISGNANGDFKINKVTGMIQTAEKLERQLMFSYNLTVKASDQGSPSLASQTSVLITVSDTNNNKPVFFQTNYFAFHLENIIGRTALLNVTATDADRGQNAIITYSIIGGNAERKFSIETKKNHGTIFVDSMLNREAKSSYSLVIKAEDGGIPFSQMAFAYVSVFVRDENDNPPVLTQRTYSAKIKENSLPGTLVILNTPIFATDADTGIGAKISYSLYGEESSQFSIDKDTGFIKVKASLNQTLDYEQKKKYEFLVRATNGNNEALKSTATITIDIMDQNDNYPTFSMLYYSAEIKESIGKGVQIINLNATDMDSNEYGAISYHIVSGTEGKFSVDRITGILRTTGNLDRELQGFYNVSIAAIDGGLNPKIGHCIVGISIIDVNDNAPVFSKTEYKVNVLESVPIGTLLATVKASDSDQGPAGLVKYSMNSDTFRIDESTGSINTTKLLDHERKSSYYLIITATDGKGVSANVSLDIAIMDTNDNAPIFLNPDPLVIDVFEKSPNGSVIAVATAEDKDSGKNGKIKYSLKENGSSLFRIDNYSGVIRLATPLDYLALHQQGIIAPGRSIEVIVNATDSGIPSLVASIKLKINIIDINEKNPYFDSMIIYATMEENALMGSKVIQVKATKNSLLSKFTYSFVVENLFFNINEYSGNITTAKILDREKDAKHILNVKVNDNEIPPRYGYTTVIVTVLDENDNFPKFRNPFVNIQIREDAKLGAKIGTVTASDADRATNALVFYKFTHANIGRNAKTIALNDICVEPLGMGNQGLPASQISSSSTLLEMNKDYSPTQARLGNVRYLQAGVQYQGAWCAGVSLNNQYLQVDLGVRKVVTRIATQGLPQGSDYITLYRLIYSDDGKVWKNISQVFTGNVDTMSIVSQEIVPDIRARFIRIIPLQWKNRICLRVEIYGCSVDYEQIQIVRLPFKIDQKQGTISVSEPLDRERKETYVIQIEAYDLGKPSLNTSMTMEIKLLDVNDNSPVFSSSIYRAVIAENSIPGQQVLVVSANDSDAGGNAKIQYSLAQSSSKFIIEATSGIVRVSGNLDYEKKEQRHFVLQILATDSGSPSLSASSSLMINITDVNDNAPIFNQSEYKLSIREGISIGSIFATITAHDIDEGENSKITYGLVGGQNYFGIRNKTGDVNVTGAIDRESVSTFDLIVIAEDRGVRRQRSSSKMSITVKDMNDNAPKFTKREYAAKLSERTNLGSMVMLVAATDLDTGSNSKISYTQLHSNETEMFQLNSTTGEIFLIKPLDREKKNSMSLTIVAEDSGSPRLSDAAKVKFVISDENDNSPVFSPQTIHVQIKEDASTGSFLVNMNATDNDIGANAALKFILVHGSDETFQIDVDTGVIRTKKLLDRERKNTYSIVVMASDKSATPLLGFATVKVTVLDVNDNKPEFLKLGRPLFIMENMPKGASVGQIFTLDKDTAENAVVEFIIQDSYSSKYFRIDSHTGVITTMTSLDRERQNNHIITIIASNTEAGIPLNSTQSFTVEVLDSNDNAPNLLPPSTGRVSEAAQIGTPIIQLVGVDADMGTNAKLAYNIRYDLSDKEADFVAINSRTGFLVTRLNILDRELRNVTVVVEVSDYGIPHPLNNTGKVVIQIEDVNDNTPEFRNKSMRSSVSEGASIGTSVTSIIAFDKDMDSNIEMVYRILSGNEKGHFGLDNKTGSLTVTSTLDRELISAYLLNISASNLLAIYKNENKSATDTVLMKVDVKDINDNSPFFQRMVFTGGVPSTAKLNTYIMDIKAADHDIGMNAAMAYSIVSGHQKDNFKIDIVTGKIYSAKAFVGMAGHRFEIAISAKDNKGLVPFNAASNVTTARIYVLNESQRVWLVLGVDANYIETNNQEFIESLSNITNCKVYLESLIKVFKKDGSSRSEIVFHCVNENLGIIIEGNEIRKKIEENRENLSFLYKKWKISQAEPVSASQTSNKEMKTYVIALIVIGIIVALLLLFALLMVIRAKRKGKVQKVSANDVLAQKAKKSEKRRRMLKRFSDDAGWTNQYEDWWKITNQKEKGNNQDSTSHAIVDTTDNYLYESKINLLKQGMLGKRNRTISDKDSNKHRCVNTLNRTVDNPVALANEHLNQDQLKDIQDEDNEIHSFEDGFNEITTL